VRGGLGTEITRDTPGQALVLEEPGTGAPASTGWQLLFLVPMWTLPILIHFYASAETHTASDTPWCALLPGAIVWYLFAGVVTYHAIAGTRVLRRFAVDRATGDWVVEEAGIAGLLPRRTSFALEEIERIEISGSLARPGPGGRLLGLMVRFVRKGGLGGRLPKWVRIEGLDRKEEGIDFALRLGAVAGLGGYRAVDDGGQFRVEVARVPGEGMRPVPSAPPAQRAGTPYVRAYQGRVFARLLRPVRWRRDSEVIARTLAVPEDRLPPYRLALALGVDLARALGVPWVFLNESGP